MNVLLGGLLLGGVCCSLGVAVAVPIQPDFDVTKITGVWYPLASIFNGELSRFDFYPFKFEAEENGKLVLSFNIPGEGTCRTQRYSLTLPGQPGDYRSKGRNPVLTDDLKQRFQTLADSLGFPGNVEPADLKGTC
ncbi:uncharacterized protein PHA67_001899 isoform 5-T5 [Liasis olivaceus]